MVKEKAMQKQMEARISLENWFETHCTKARSVVWETQAEKKIVDGSSRKLAKWKVEFGEVGGTLFAIIIMEKSDEHPQKLRAHVMYYILHGSTTTSQLGFWAQCFILL